LKKIIRIFSGLLLLLILVFAIIQGFVGFLYPLRYESEIRTYAQKYQLDPYFVMGVIKAESNFKPDAHSGVARGLMQITDKTAQWIAGQMERTYSPDDLEIPEKNIEMGCFYLDYLCEHYKNREVALAAYNAGMGNVSEWLSDERYSKDAKALISIPFPETATYVEKVGRYEQVYQFLYKNK